jgi:hypothetical protein
LDNQFHEKYFRRTFDNTHASAFEMIATALNNFNDVFRRIAGVIEHPANDLVLLLYLFVTPFTLAAIPRVDAKSIN